MAAAPRIGAAALVALIAACGTAGSSAEKANDTAVTVVRAAAEPAGTISESGSGLLFPLAKKWAAAYHQQFPGVTVSTASTGSGKGIALASAGQVDIGASDAYLSSGDLVKNPALLNIPLAISAQTITYNIPGLPRGSHVDLNGTVLAGIYDGTITMWDDPAIVGTGRNKNLNLPAIPIVPLHRSDGSGDTFLFTSYLSTQDQQWNDTIGYGTTAAWPPAPKAAPEQGSVKTMDACEATPGCIAYNGISYLAQAQGSGKIGEAALANSAGDFTLPTSPAILDAVRSFVPLIPPNETISVIEGPAADGYPIVNYEYAIVSTRQPSPAKAAAIKAFLNWVITTGNALSYLNTVGFQPLPATLVSLGADQIREIGS
jgi:phosphate transport system substrate-binding protein